MFSNGGESIGSVELNTPFGVCVVGQYVYVVSHSNHGMWVFTTEGEYVTSFGEHA